MRISEVSRAPGSSIDTQRILALCQFLLGRSQDTGASPKISTDSFIKLANNQGISLTQELLTRMAVQPPLSNFIASVDDNTVTFKSDDAPVPDTMTVDQARDTVDSMAKRAAAKASKPL